MTKQKGHSNSVDLRAIAERAMAEAGFDPDFDADVRAEVEALETGKIKDGDAAGVRWRGCGREHRSVRWRR